VGSQLYASVALPTGEIPGTHCTRSWEGPGDGLDGCGKSRASEFDPRTVQPVVSRYTDSAIPARSPALSTDFYLLQNIQPLEPTQPPIRRETGAPSPGAKQFTTHGQGAKVNKTGNVRIT
jgi:hypothetical protein